MALKPVTVSQLNEYIDRILRTDPLLGAVVVKGELTGVKYHSSGHVYFSITDGMSKVNCFLPHDYAIRLPLQIEDGMAVVIQGSISVFKKNGTYSLYVRNLEIEGEGNLAIAFEKMKNKLQKMGYFDPAHKKPIPRFPAKIGVVTSNTGAAIRDILKILDTRNKLVDVIVFPVLVQGVNAAFDISSKIDYINANFDDIDTLIVGRGGGSQEDLWAFNEEIVAESIYNSRIPVISAVGHEVDFTISDMVADLRAETPTAAAQLAVPDLAKLKEETDKLKDDMRLMVSNKIMYNTLRADKLISEMKHHMESLIREKERQLESYRTILEENSPSKVMNSGYCIATSESGAAVRSVGDVKEGSMIDVRVSDGKLSCQVMNIRKDQYEQR